VYTLKKLYSGIPTKISFRASETPKRVSESKKKVSEIRVFRKPFFNPQKPFFEFLEPIIGFPKLGNLFWSVFQNIFFLECRGFLFLYHYQICIVNSLTANSNETKQLDKSIFSPLERQR